MKGLSQETMERLHNRFQRLFDPVRADVCIDRLEMLVGRYGVGSTSHSAHERWSEKDTLLITYGDMVSNKGENPLHTLHRFLNTHLSDGVNTVHLLPFFPYSSDDGFSVIDFRSVDPALGSWEDIQDLTKDFNLMTDLVLNHVSRKSAWFKDFVGNVSPARHYFIEASPDEDLSAVVRPRAHPLLTKVRTTRGDKHVWTTFSEDQVDVNFANSDVLFEFLDILFLYIAMGARIIRMDAIAYLWKRSGTSCIHLPETHEVVKIFRDVLDMVSPDTILLTETNVPHEENISYFGASDEAHMVYQFSLPPLTLHALLNGTAKHLTAWAKTVCEAPPDCTYLNFTASHDGIGVRPLQGLVPPKELDALAETVRKRGGQVSTKSNGDGTESPYELNITYFDAVANGTAPKDLERYLCSQTIPLVLRGIPAVYFNSLIGARNHVEGMAKTGMPRTINRQKWTAKELEGMLANKQEVGSRVFRELTRRLSLRRSIPAFHPEAQQAVHDLGNNVFAVERTGLDGERVLALHNVTSKPLKLDLTKLKGLGLERYLDLLTMEVEETNALALSPYQCRWLKLE